MKESIRSLFDPNNELDEKSVEFLVNALDSHPQQGFDYLKFKTSVEQLLKMGMDESTAVRSAYATASTIGLTKDKLRHSQELYQKVIISEREQFEAAMRNQLQKRVASKEDETEYLKEKIIEYKQKIDDLQKQITSYQDKVNNADAAISKEREKISTTKKRFIEAHESFIETIKKDQTLFDQYL